MNDMKTRVVFMGSPDFALPTLQALHENFRVVGVVTQPDRPAGRGRKLQPPDVKVLAQSLNLPIIQPGSLKATDAVEQLQLWSPDVIVVAAFGQILRENVLNLPVAISVPLAFKVLFIRPSKQFALGTVVPFIELQDLLVPFITIRPTFYTCHIILLCEPLGAGDLL
jgi:hypothetical protein